MTSARRDERRGKRLDRFSIRITRPGVPCRRIFRATRDRRELRLRHRLAASRTVRAIGPGVSWLWAIGITPDRLTRPRVGLMPTSPFAEAGHTTEPSVSVPIATAQRFAPTAAPEPELEPQGLRSRA